MSTRYKTLNESAGTFEVKPRISNELLEIERSIKQLEARRDTLKEQLKEEMGLAGVTSLETPVAVFSYVGEVQSSRFDSARFKKEKAELYAEYTLKYTNSPTLKINWRVATSAEAIKSDTGIINTVL